jgi:hypothetical protein
MKFLETQRVPFTSKHALEFSLTSFDFAKRDYDPQYEVNFGYDYEEESTEPPSMRHETKIDHAFKEITEVVHTVAKKKKGKKGGKLNVKKTITEPVVKER